MPRDQAGTLNGVKAGREWEATWWPAVFCSAEGHPGDSKVLPAGSGCRSGDSLPSTTQAHTCCCPSSILKQHPLTVDNISHWKMNHMMTQLPFNFCWELAWCCQNLMRPSFLIFTWWLPFKCGRHCMLATLAGAKKKSVCWPRGYQFITNNLQIQEMWGNYQEAVPWIVGLVVGRF